MNRKSIVFVGLLLLLLLYGGYRAVVFALDLRRPGSERFVQWWQGNDATREALVVAEREACASAPFILPSDGFIGLLYGDPRGPYSSSNPHQGIDVFSNADPGVTPVYAAYDGYITREPGWRSTVIQRVPDDPLQPGRQIWLYYTHMADRDGSDFIVDAIPPGTRELFVEQGTLLGYTGDYNGNAARSVWVHLHFSIVRDDGSGRYTNELAFENTIDPSPYFGRALNYACAPEREEAAACTAEPLCVSPAAE